MYVTELALISIPSTPPTADLPPTLTSTLCKALKVLSEHSHHPFSLVKVKRHINFISPEQVATATATTVSTTTGIDAGAPTQLLLIGGWDTLTFHTSDFLPSPANQNLINTLNGLCTVRWMVHVGALPTASFNAPGTSVLLIAVGVVAGKTNEWDRHVWQGMEMVEDVIANVMNEEGVKCGDGWRVQEERAAEGWGGGEEVWVLKATADREGRREALEVLERWVRDAVGKGREGGCVEWADGWWGEYVLGEYLMF